MVISWYCGTNLAIEQPVRPKFYAWRAHFDTREAWLPRREVRMVLFRGPSWRQGSRPQPVSEMRDLGEQRSGDSDLRELECGVAAMAHDLGSDLEKLLPIRGQRQVARVPRRDPMSPLGYTATKRLSRANVRSCL